MAWSGVREKSATFDEIAHLTGGYSIWHTGDFRLNPENGNLPQRWATLPLMAMDLHFPDRDDPHWQSSNVWELGYDFFYTLGNDLEAMLWRSRGMIVLLGMVLGVIVFVWSRRLFGVEGAFLSLAMMVFCPSLLAHSALATSDLAATLLFVTALGGVWIALHRVSPWSVLASGLVLGGLFVSKMSAVVILPVMLILLAIRVAVGRPLCVVWRKKTSIVRDRWRQLAVLTGVLVCQGARRAVCDLVVLRISLCDISRGRTGSRSHAGKPDRRRDCRRRRDRGVCATGERLASVAGAVSLRILVRREDVRIARGISQWRVQRAGLADILSIFAAGKNAARHAGTPGRRSGRSGRQLEPWFHFVPASAQPAGSIEPRRSPCS